MKFVEFKYFEKPIATSYIIMVTHSGSQKLQTAKLMPTLIDHVVQVYPAYYES